VSTPVAVSVESLCNTLARHHILPADEIRGLRERYKQSAGPNASGDDFLRWLVANKTLTEYQRGVLARDNAEQLLIGPYVIQDRVGKGRMAGVYKAKHRTGQTVAVKVLPPSRARNTQTLARFQRESRLALRLKHPNVVRTFQAGEHNSLHYIVMEYLEGEPLDEVLTRRGKLATAEAVRLVHQVLLGLDEMFEKGMVHRDVKPGNVMVIGGTSDSTSAAKIKLLDVGAARADFDEEQVGALTVQGDMLGSPEYVSPEQAEDAHSADVRSDLYSVGCVLYHCLAGRPPFNDANPTRLAIKHATEAPRPIQEFNPAVPEGLQLILDYLLAKDPAARYPTPQRAAKALEVFLAAASEPEPAAADESMKTYLGTLAAEEDQETINVELVAVVVPEAATKLPPPPPPPPPIAAPVPVAAPVIKARSAAGRDGAGFSLFGLSGRDLVMLLVGIAGLAVVMSISLAVFAIVRSRG
jgi:serine/threonine-protein kinase